MTLSTRSLGAALYFCFISLTTIGFGDLIPRKSFMNPRKDFWSLTKMIFTVAYIIIGEIWKIFTFISFTILNYSTKSHIGYSNVCICCLDLIAHFGIGSE
jgi:hypothetical protein